MYNCVLAGESGHTKNRMAPSEAEGFGLIRLNKLPSTSLGAIGVL
jgi:hypothetical protein